MGGNDLREHDLARLRRALALAPKGRHRVEPNPIVGCVLERDGRVVGEGWHAAYGGAHAEVVALEKAGTDAEGATAYVSLEPCSRRGKTGPCVDALIRSGVRRVIFASSDPAERGRGARRLAEAGVDVQGPALPGEGDALLSTFLRMRDAERPWVALKWAMTLDGRVAEGRGRGGAITGPRSLAFVHALRAHADAVAVGVGTILVDDPRLTVRHADGERDAPIRVVFDSNLRTPTDARLFEDIERAPVWLVAARADSSRRRGLEARGAEVVEAGASDGRVDLAAALPLLRERGVHRMLVEGGPRVHGALLARGFADQVTALVAPRVLGEAEAPGAVEGAGFGGLAGAVRLEDVVWRRMGDDLVVEGAVPVSG